MRPNDTVATIPRDGFSAAYMFQILYDSTGMTQYVFTECKKNGVRLRLPQWVLNRSVNADAQMLSWNSRTDPFVMAAGDTLSFYRDLYWYNPRTFRSALDSYYALDTLDYAVELVRSSDSTRIALLDSIGVLPCKPPGVPCIYGMRPMMALVQYRVPADLAGVKGFIRIRLYARGEGEYFFTRSDRTTYGLSSRLRDIRWLHRMDEFNQRFAGKYSTKDLSSLSTAADDGLDVRLSAASPSDATIRFTVPPSSRAAIAIYNAAGEAVFYPYTGITSAREHSLTYHFPESGLYFIGLLIDAELVATRKIIIN